MYRWRYMRMHHLGRVEKFGSGPLFFFWALLIWTLGLFSPTNKQSCFHRHRRWGGEQRRRRRERSGDGDGGREAGPKSAAPLVRFGNWIWIWDVGSRSWSGWRRSPKLDLDRMSTESERGRRKPSFLSWIGIWDVGSRSGSDGDGDGRLWRL